MASVQTSAEIDALLHPARQYQSPAEVLADPSLTLSERRAILSSWASDACAVESMPSLRRAPFAARPVTFDQVMDALVQLDADPRARSDAREKFTEWTAAGEMRHPAFLGLREDKKPKDVVLEKELHRKG
jgi:hypothetical protein